MKRRVIMPKEPRRRDGRRPHLSRKRMAGRVRATLRMYWMDAVSRGSPMPAASMT